MCVARDLIFVFVCVCACACVSMSDIKNPHQCMSRRRACVHDFARLFVCRIPRVRRKLQHRHGKQHACTTRPVPFRHSSAAVPCPATTSSTISAVRSWYVLDFIQTSGKPPTLGALFNSDTNLSLSSCDWINFFFVQHRGGGRGQLGWGLCTSPHAPDPTQS